MTSYFESVFFFSRFAAQVARIFAFVSSDFGFPLNLTVVLVLKDDELFQVGDGVTTDILPTGFGYLE